MGGSIEKSPLIGQRGCRKVPSNIRQDCSLTAAYWCQPKLKVEGGDSGDIFNMFSSSQLNNLQCSLRY